MRTRREWEMPFVYELIRVMKENFIDLMLKNGY